MIAPKANAAFVCQMEEILQLYTRPYDSRYPLVCFDEISKQLVSETRIPLPMRPGCPKRYDYEYARNGVCNLFMLFEPLAAQRHVVVTERRTQLDYAYQMEYLVDVLHPRAWKILVVQDNLNTHVPAALYKAFAPIKARHILNKLEFHYTPKHGSWLNMAEIELSVLSRQCLNRRIAGMESLQQEVQAWQDERNKAYSTVDWRFTTRDARIKLKHLYPSTKP